MRQVSTVAFSASRTRMSASSRAGRGPGCGPHCGDRSGADRDGSSCAGPLDLEELLVARGPPRQPAGSGRSSGAGTCRRASRRRPPPRGRCAVARRESGAGSGALGRESAQSIARQVAESVRGRPVEKKINTPVSAQAEHTECLGPVEPFLRGRRGAERRAPSPRQARGFWRSGPTPTAVTEVTLDLRGQRAQDGHRGLLLHCAEWRWRRRRRPSDGLGLRPDQVRASR